MSFKKSNVFIISNSNIANCTYCPMSSSCNEFFFSIAQQFCADTGQLVAFQYWLHMSTGNYRIVKRSAVQISWHLRMQFNANKQNNDFCLIHTSFLEKDKDSGTSRFILQTSLTNFFSLLMMYNLNPVHSIWLTQHNLVKRLVEENFDVCISFDIKDQPSA